MILKAHRAGSSKRVHRRPFQKARGTAFDWKDPQLAPTYKPTRPVSYRRANVPPVDIEHLLVAGAPVMANFDLYVGKDKGTYPFFPLVHFRRARGNTDPAPIPRGSLLMYAGQIRCTERLYKFGKRFNVSVIKHTFITPLGRCIIHNLRLLAPT